MDGWLRHRADARWLTWVTSDGTSLENGVVIGGIGPNPPGRIGYQVGDEPGTVEEMNAIVAGLDAVRAADPEGLRVVNFSHLARELDAMVDQYCESGLGDVISYDRYTRSNRGYEQLAYFREAGLRCGMPWWRYIKAYVSGPDDPIQTESDLRWAAFVGMVYGYTGHTWFLYLVRGGDAEGIPTTLFTATEDWASPPTPRFDQVAAINRELIFYGRALTQLLSTGVGWATDSTFAGLHPPAGAPRWRPDMDPNLEAVDLEGRYADALLGFFVDAAGDRYVIVQNPNHENGDFPTDGEDRLRATLRFALSGSGAAEDRVLVLDPAAGGPVPRPLRDGALEVDLAAGDVLFFKYDTGRPFAGFE